jgi:hypothetical protein
MQPYGVRISVGRPHQQEAPPSSAAHAIPGRPAFGGRRGHSRFSQPPLDPAGTLCDASDRPLLCCSLQGQEVVVGSADHALYAYDASSDTGRPTRRLYGKRHGHIDWCVHDVENR